MVDEAPSETQGEFRVVEVIDVSVPLPAQHAEVHLTELEPPYRSLSLPVGIPEGAAIIQAMNRGTGVRPQTHELFSEVLAHANVDVIALRLVERRGSVVIAEIDLMTSRGRQVLDCRPSDGIALCLRQLVPAPILVEESVFDEVDDA